MNMHRIITVLIIGFFSLTACEDVVEVDVNKSETQICIDAIITNAKEPQVVRISQSIAYFDNSGDFPPYAVDSVVMSDNLGNKYYFDKTQTGVYTYLPSPLDSLEQNSHFILKVYKGQAVYTAQSTLMRSTSIDSLTYQYNERMNGYIVSLHARDAYGVGDCYWLRTYRNGVFMNHPGKINIAYDAGYPQMFSDSLEFVFPIAIMQINDFEKPYQIGEKVKVEILGINGDYYQYLSMAQQQMQNGGMFAPPPVNVRTNFTANAHALTPVGFFNVCEVQSAEIEIIK
ncbi:MAG: DUF4249 domain-containing protein [Bacteroidia bacterium]|nr:DUF4249 domain-containing protein [Bacteroidia bacterium]